jgi:hypothetical protein
MRAPLQRPTFGAVVHAADTGGELGPAPAYSHSSSRATCSASSRVGAMTSAIGLSAYKQHVLPVQNLGRNRKAEGHGLARSGLRRHQKVAPGHAVDQHGILHGESGSHSPCLPKPAPAARPRFQSSWMSFQRGAKPCAHKAKRPLSPWCGPPRPQSRNLDRGGPVSETGQHAVRQGAGRVEPQAFTAVDRSPPPPPVRRSGCPRRCPIPRPRRVSIPSNRPSAARHKPIGQRGSEMAGDLGHAARPFLRHHVALVVRISAPSSRSRRLAASAGHPSAAARFRMRCRSGPARAGYTTPAVTRPL